MIAERWRAWLEQGRERGAARSGTLARVLENTVWLLAGKGVGAVLSLVYLGLATRTLGAERFGHFVLVLGTAQAIGAFVNFQSWQIVVRFGMAHLHAKRYDAIGRLIGFSATLDLVGAVVGCAIATVAVSVLGPHFGWDEAVRHEALLFSFVLLLSIRSTAIGILRLNDRFGLGAVADAATPVSRCIGALVVLATGPSINGFLGAWAVAEVVSATVYWTFALHVGKALGRIRVARIGAITAENPGVLRFAAITNAGSTLNAVGKQFAVLIVGFFVGPVAAGIYRLAFQLGQALARVSEMFSRAVFAELTRLNFGDRRADLKRLFRNTTRLVAGAAAIVVLILFVGGKTVLGVIAGPEYSAAYPLLLLLGGAAALDLGGVGFEPALLATDRAGTALCVRLITTLAMIALLFLLLPPLGVTGAAMATLGASAMGLVLFGITAWRAIYGPPSRIVPAALQD